MKRLFFIATITALLVSCRVGTVSQRTSFLQIPDETAPVDTIDLAFYEEKYGDYDGVYLEYHSIGEHSGYTEWLSDIPVWDFCFMLREKYVVLNPDAQWLTTLTLPAVPDKLYMQTTSPDGKVNRYDGTDLQVEGESSDAQLYKFAFPDIVKGTIIEHGFEHCGSDGWLPLRDADLPLQFGIPCETLVVSYCYPDWWELGIKNIAKGTNVRFDVKDDSITHKRTLSHEATNVPAVVDEPYSPYFREMARYLKFQIVDLNSKSGFGERPQSWTLLIERFREYYLPDRKKTSKHAREVAQRLADQCDTDLQTIEAIAYWVQDSIEVVYDAHHRGSPSKTFKKRNGDPIDVVSLTVTMMTEVGLKANVILVHSAEHGYFDKRFVSFDQLGIPAVGVAVGDDYHVHLPYFENLPINHTPESFQGQPAIVVDEDAARFVDVPKGSRANNTSDRTFEVAIGNDGLVRVEEERTIRGSTAWRSRNVLKDLKDDEIKEFMDSLLTYTDGNVDSVSYDILNLESYKEPLIYRLTYTIDNLITVTPDEVLFQTAGLFSPVSTRKNQSDPKKRHNPIKIFNDEQFNAHIVINFPENWLLDTDFEPVEFSNRFGSLQGEYLIEANRLEISQSVRLNRCFEPKEKYGELMELTGSKSRLYVPNIVFSIVEEMP